VAAAILSSSACKNRHKTLTPVAIDPGAENLDVQGDLRSAPVWPQVERSVLANGLLVHWLPEENAAGLHLRLLLPTGQGKDLLAAATLNVFAGAVHDGIKRRTRGLHVAIAVVPAPGRIEVIVRADEKDAARVYGAIGKALATDPNEKLLNELLRREKTSHTRIASAEASSNALLGELLGLPRTHLHSSQAETAALSPDLIRRSWRSFMQPRRAVLLVHASGALQGHENALASVARSWRAAGPQLSAAEESATGRLRPPSPKKAKRSGATKSARILGSPSAPLHVVKELEVSQKQAVVSLGRVIPTPTARHRALARLAQRLIAQDSDLRLVVAGPFSVLILRARVSARDPRASLAKTVEKLQGYATKPFNSGRMQQAARLWLGARIVAASLEAEDWTMLYSEALDLASKDEDARDSLARDARFMLEATPDDLLEFTKAWFAPKSGEPGWGWWIAGASAETLAELAPLLAKD
jgi:hypothetical protein